MLYNSKLSEGFCFLMFANPISVADFRDLRIVIMKVLNSYEKEKRTVTNILYQVGLGLIEARRKKWNFS